MGRCNNADLLAKIGQKKIDTNAEIDFSIRRELPDCRKINAKNAINASLPYDRYQKPVNRFECGAEGCSTSGTATVADSAKYFASFDATDFAAGIVTFYVLPTKYPTTLSFKIASEEGMENYDAYDVEITEGMAMDDGYVPVVIDLSKAPASEGGNGWEPSQTGAYIEIEVAPEAGISTISILDSMEDFETVSTVKVSCVSSAGGSYDLSTIEQTCREAELDDSISTLSFPITANLMTPNWYLLNPMYQKGTETEGFRPVTIKKLAEEYMVGEDRYGRVVLADAHETECRFWGVQIANDCSPFDAMLKELSVPVIAGVDAGHYQVLRNADGVSVLFNEALIGKEVLIEYPAKAEIEEFVFGTDDINSVKTSMTVPYCFDGNVQELHIYDNVLVTGFPFGLSNTDQEASFTITITKKNGKFFRVQRFID